MIKLICIIALLLISGCSNLSTDDKLEPEVGTACVSEVFTEDNKCVISDFKNIRVKRQIHKVYDISEKTVELNSDDLIALAIDLTRKKIDEMQKRPGYSSDWKTANLSFTPYLYYEYGNFIGVTLEFKDDLDNYGYSKTTIIDSKWLILTDNDLQIKSKLNILGKTTTDCAEYKVDVAGGFLLLSRKGNVINLIEMLKA